MSTAPFPRIVVVGSSCAGKTTFAGRLAAARGCARIELDELYWGADWTPRPEAEFLRRVDEAARGAAWVAAGNYSPARPLLWSRATTVVWLDFSLPRVFWRGLRRTLGHCLTGEALHHGNRESLRRSLLSRESILWWILSTFQRRRREFDALRRSGEYPHLAWHRAADPRAAEAVLQALMRG